MGVGTEAAPPLLELAGINKSFGGVAALREVDFTLRAGEIHGLVGENGAGKSTLMKIIAGVHADYGGTLRIDGQPLRFRSARDALRAGIGMVHQELSIVPDLTVAENVFLGSQPITRFGVVDWRRMNARAAELLRDLGIDVDPRVPIGSLPIGLQQLIEIARVLFSGARIIILDEPTSALSPPEIERLFGLLRGLRASGRSMIFISHFLDDILNVSDTVTIFRNGRKIVTAAASDASKGWVIENMIGKGHEDLEESYTSDMMLDSKPDAAVVLETSGLRHGRAFRDVSLRVRAGEVLGIYGFMGSGQLELARALFGKLRPDGGTLTIGGRQVTLNGTAAAKRAGVAFVPESRRSMLFSHEPIYKNMSISILDRLHPVLLRPAAERSLAERHVVSLGIRPPRVDQALGTLSGGNQQKVGLAKWLTYLPKVLVLSEPTRGMDVGAKEDVVKIVRSLREQGVGIVVVSSEPETVLSLSDRILVMRKGEIAREFASETVSKDRLLDAA
ncbi:ABC transporter ATP-binding protein [Skermanella stibiiresistens SB22]|uniref:ABC transporter ATP-binding protein n=1 Tax=Skermanella stibiiresistens SB22 TaxID=1385369 RepID=W9GYK7_9PROT|nr:sugar ABC transporter ATP-binding protein [Skermanella stibiiresistens]EWY39020.1 ABC transporter ATP-binding protein [Skermanella stibiiresistens SB22]